MPKVPTSSEMPKSMIILRVPPEYADEDKCDCQRGEGNSHYNEPFLRLAEFHRVSRVVRDEFHEVGVVLCAETFVLVVDNCISDQCLWKNEAPVRNFVLRILALLSMFLLLGVNILFLSSLLGRRDFAIVLANSAFHRRGWDARYAGSVCDGRLWLLIRWHDVVVRPPLLHQSPGEGLWMLPISCRALPRTVAEEMRYISVLRSNHSRASCCRKHISWACLVRAYVKSDSNRCIELIKKEVSSDRF